MDVIKFSEFNPDINEGLKASLQNQWQKFLAAVKSTTKDFGFEQSDFTLKDLSAWLDGKKNIRQICQEKPAPKEDKLD